MLDFSIIIPIFNEEAVIETVVQELLDILETTNLSFEILLVNDGSTDCTWEIISTLRNHDSRINPISLDGHYGQTAALHAGIQMASGNKIIMLDGDGQNDPKNIPEMIKLSSEYDVICGWRIKRHDNFIRKISSLIANRIRQKVLGDNIPDIGCTLKIFPADKLKKVVLFEGFHRFLPILLELEGCSVVSIPVNHRPRKAGYSKYSVSNRLFKATMDMFVVRWMKNRKLKYKLKAPGK
ncbi:MAG: hypothetical protein A2161_08290 [Candidatus Schekmanbacteria bacterium RBG_13_48_7]|uniref:Glycosyltransferase 2-like domain-containing protein n=1 Tax=Candidatus Schekmanbacteria bacterium RBG_13_48_7 TaxID=1817878 RepID=A0A1F7S9N7_9BACT|nr:MAG: hypothetical protein A2161_08290 [Candidatus Schekmanbacteria bacterium RBG_13_48_7]